jgi:hypothetical protein
MYNRYANESKMIPTEPLNPCSPEAIKAAGLRPVRLGLFPVMDTPEAVIDLGVSQLPITNPNQLVGLLMTYHNSLVNLMETKNEDPPATVNV